MMKTVQTLPVQYCFFDFVTNHDYTQRFVARYNPVDMALFIGCQSCETQAKLEKLGIGVDPKQTDRYSLLLSVIPQVKHPFGKSVALPINLGETLGFLLTPLNISWVPAPRFQMLPPDGECQTHLQPAQGAVIFDLIRPGRKALEKILQEWHQLLRNGYQYAAVDICLASPGIGQLYDVLAANGFFVAGFIPYHHSDKLGIRFQSIGPTKLDFNEVIVFSPTAKRLLEIIRNNYERNGLL